MFYNYSHQKTIFRHLISLRNVLPIFYYYCYSISVNEENSRVETDKCMRFCDLTWAFSLTKLIMSVGVYVLANVRARQTPGCGYITVLPAWAYFGTLGLCHINPVNRHCSVRWHCKSLSAQYCLINSWSRNPSSQCNVMLCSPMSRNLVKSYTAKCTSGELRPTSLKT